MNWFTYDHVKITIFNHIVRVRTHFFPFYQFNEFGELLFNQWLIFGEQKGYYYPPPFCAPFGRVHIIGKKIKNFVLSLFKESQMHSMLPTVQNNHLK